jgi:CheY-like chemotaxis protein
MARILITDDSTYQRGRLRRMLEEWGHDTIEATNGEEALHAAKTESLDAILLDLIMPEVQGFDVLRELRGRPATAPIIVVTADIQTEVRSECMELGAAAFLNKPVDADQLRTILDQVLESRQAPKNESSSL